MDPPRDKTWLPAMHTSQYWIGMARQLETWVKEAVIEDASYGLAFASMCRWRAAGLDKLWLDATAWEWFAACRWGGLDLDRSLEIALPDHGWRKPLAAPHERRPLSDPLEPP